VLLCPPIGQEYVRSHWAIRQVALALVRAGFHCFRFDWFGVGDSSGELAEATLARWKEDAVNAAQELRDAAGVRKLSIVGLRFGATVAAMAAREIAPSSLILWDPVLEGASYVAQLRRIHEQLISDQARYWSAPPRRPDEGGTELCGFDFGEGILAEIRRVEAAQLADLPRARVCLLRSSGSSDLSAFEQRLRAGALEVELRSTTMQAKWASARDVEELLLPADAVRATTAFLEGRTT
jgi:pimeloyl-ACP methyl ester carboxylesterase